ncbi:MULTISPECIES: tail assembly protein [Yersinia]|uniref:tail assembly protein n=2 Tax=Yersiniaceae TaxID=1903411 RepID=UPI0005DFC47C|nr:MULTISPECIES: tail assembly protein [Yersinia]PHZ21497.1 tail assembly protein [Yersinia massiliensis]CNH88435.1 putative phage tail assembly protein [Yersinia massiliensis]CNJ95647.1 putative phage tail assembly protein [Yersinia frederiksenii]CQI99350.1 putative phage tail assembly protein [Yersinia frederiksenii]
MSEVKTIRLYGQLKQFTENKDGIFRFAASSTQEAIKACCVLLPGFERFLNEAKDKGLTFAVFKGKRNISKDELEFNIGDEEIKIAPIIIGSKKAGLFQTILGAVLIAAALWNPVIGGAALMSAKVAYGVGMMGASLALGGMVQMLSPQQGGLAMRESPDNKPSYAFGGPVNSIAQGNPVPLGYGKRRIGGALISAGIHAEDQQ